MIACGPSFAGPLAPSCSSPRLSTGQPSRAGMGQEPQSQPGGESRPAKGNARSRWSLSRLGSLVLALVAVVGSGAIMPSQIFAQAPDPVEAYGVDFEVLIDAAVTRIESFMVPLLLVSLGILGIVLFLAWIKRTAR